MAISKAQQKAVSKYVKEKYDRIEIKAPKGKKELIQAHAEAHSESVNGFINRAIDQVMAQEAVGSSTGIVEAGVVYFYGDQKRAPAASEGRTGMNEGGTPNE